MSFNKNNKLGSQFLGFIIAAVIVGSLYIFFTDKNINHSAVLQNSYSPVGNNDQPNALENIENDDERRRAELQKNAQPFLAKVMLRYSDDGSVLGPVHLKASNKKDAVFIVRNKLNNAIIAIVQVPRGSSEKLMLPIGDYSIEYAQGDGLWQGLGELWGLSTKFYKSTSDHYVAQEFTQTGYKVRGVGVQIGTDEGTVSERISKRQFVSD
ncbi:hypothetical protein [Acinetobacter sp. PK01]|uniref:hypothetical protein n=1 Tax=Acinetobacter sp. PK01 TaxID=2930198 RepID=UPI001FB812CF|nr:hypothetical protein [Acinetobacter sp. PK01]UOG18991.1 hypothetical protein MP622_05150 [Acinetobacter sp. PK01]